MTDDEFSLLLAERYLEMIAANHPEFARETDENINFEFAGGQGDVAVASRMIGEVASIELRWERHLRTAGESIEPAFHYSFVVQSYENGKIICAEGPAIPYPDNVTAGLVDDLPEVLALIASDVKRPMGDRIRVLSCLVRLCCKIIGSGSDFVRAYAKVVGFFGDAVCLLRHLVGVARLEHGDNAEDHADDADSDAEDVRCAHMADSTGGHHD